MSFFYHGVIAGDYLLTLWYHFAKHPTAWYENYCKLIVLLVFLSKQSMMQSFLRILTNNFLIGFSLDSIYS